jgi:streptogramin lyase
MSYNISTNQGAVVRKLDLNANPPTVQNYYLPDGNVARSVVVSDIGNIYAAGFVSRYPNSLVPEVAKFWKIDTQGQIQHFDLNDSYSRAEAVCLSANGDIYVAGHINNMLAKVWKIDEQTNSVQFFADIPGDQATAMFISGNGDLYVAGRAADGRTGAYWVINPQTKSIKTYPLQSDPYPSNYSITSIFVK